MHMKNWKKFNYIGNHLIYTNESQSEGNLYSNEKRFQVNVVSDFMKALELIQSNQVFLESPPLSWNKIMIMQQLFALPSFTNLPHRMLWLSY